MSRLAGIGGLVQLILRRDRLILPVWLVATVGIVLQWAVTASTVYPTVASRQARVDEVAASPMFLLFQGQLFDPSLGAVLMQRAAPAAMMLAALGTALILVRHTRAEEQSGRRELLGSTVVGRHAPLTAALVVLFGCGLLIGSACGVALVAAGLPVVGSICAGLVIGSGVWTTAVTTAVLVQLTQSPLAAAIGGFVAFYAFHLLRGVGAMGGDSTAWLVWLTPNGWLENARPYGGERWWVFALVALWIVLLAGIAYALSARRDLGAGLLPARLGPAGAAAALRGPVGLAWRMHRAMLIVWLATATALGGMLGYVGAGAMEAYARSPWIVDYARAINAANPADALFTYIVAAMAILIAMYAVLTVLRLRSEETGGGAETVLAGPVARRHWMAAHLGFAFGAPVLILIALGLGLGLGLGNGMNNGDLAGELAHMLRLTIPLAPAIWVIAGVTAAAFGLLPQASAALGWTALGIGIAAEIAVKAYLLPDWVYHAVSPFAQVSPAYNPAVVDYVGLVVISGLLIIVGGAGFRRRDLVT